MLNAVKTDTNDIDLYRLSTAWFPGIIGAGAVTTEYYLDASPPEWIFTIWIVIFLFQWGWVIYVLTTLCRRNQSGRVFLNPPVVSPFFLWLYCVLLGLNVTWLFLIDNGLLIWAYVDNVLVWVTLMILFVSNLRAVDRYGVELRQNLYVIPIDLCSTPHDNMNTYNPFIIRQKKTPHFPQST